MSFQIIQGDITDLNTDAIVNAANNQLLPGGGVCGAIFSKAGYNDLLQECEKIGFCPTGSAVITNGYNLKAKNIIHAVGPVWRGGKNNEEKDLRSAYRESLALAKKNNLKSIAFPLISGGIYGYPVNEAKKIAQEELENFSIENPDIDVFLCLYK